VELTQNIAAGQIRAVVAVDGGVVNATSFLSVASGGHPGGVLVTSLVGPAGPKAGVKVETWTLDSARAPGTAGVSNVQWATRTGLGPLRQVRAALATAVISGSSPHAVEPEPQHVITAVVSSLDVGSLEATLPTAQQQALTLKSGGTAALTALGTAVAEWYARFWSRSWVALPDQPQLEEFWFKSLYLLAACNRKGKVAPGIFGSWVTTDRAAWHGDYTLNYNFEAPYFGAFSSNHVDLLDAYWPAILQMVPQGKKDAEVYKCPGVHFPGHIAPFGQKNWIDAGQHTDAIFAALHFINHWRHTRSRRFFAVSYPFLKEVADFWTCWLTKTSTGQYNDTTDCTREGCYGPSWKPTRNDLNTVTAVTFVKFLFTHLCETAALSGVDAQTLALWMDIRDNIAPAPLGQFPRSSNTTVFLPQEACCGSPYFFKQQDDPLVVYPIYPGEQVGLSSALQKVAVDTVLAVDAWQQGNAFPQIFPAAVRAGVNFTVINEQLLQRFTHMPPNGYLSQSGGGIETAGGLLCVTEMLLQSWDGVLRLFPVWGGGDAQFCNLRAVGAFLVSVRRMDDAVLDWTVESEAGEPCTFLSPWPGRPSVAVRGANVPLIAKGRGEWTFATQMGRVYSIEPPRAG
jgi:hypothetical protein